ncbi:hypothetical protein CIL03_08415 [Virgibacillus indicus]|uniref:Conjugal transfer protein n=1 Tax=Virgibacillus indicus TaxID=2024554 RepID=A0A265NB38_9BACI|nr:conjugal transfer protein [Virgibacillus indicus]OZU89031.1 hypothetical protein CIL03_08415 [Virgibacillus indicus]
MKKKKKNHNEENKNRVSVLQKLKRVFASSERPQKAKQQRPKTYAFRKFGALIFWLIFAFMFLVVAVSITSDSTSSEAKETEINVEVNPSTKPEAIQFAKDFIKNYFTWSNSSEGWEERANRLSGFIAEGLEEQAGLIKESVVWDAIYNNSVIKRMEEIDSNSVHMTFQVSAEMSREVEKKVEEKKEGKDEKKEEVEGTQIETETVPIVKYFVVPLTYNGSTYGVNELPYVTSIEEKTDVEKQSDANLSTEKDSKKVVNIKNFLDTFFASYAEDEKDRLGYILTDKENPNGMNGTMHFVEVKEAEVYKGKTKDENLVITKVTFEDPELNTQLNSVFHLIVTKEKDRYVVSNINAEKINN